MEPPPTHKFTKHPHMPLLPVQIPTSELNTVNTGWHPRSTTFAKSHLKMSKKLAAYVWYTRQQMEIEFIFFLEHF